MGVAALLAVPEYRGAILEGLVASIGGLDALLSKEASAALVLTLTAAHSSKLPTVNPEVAETSLLLHKPVMNPFHTHACSQT